MGFRNVIHYYFRLPIEHQIKNRPKATYESHLKNLGSFTRDQPQSGLSLRAHSAQLRINSA